MRALWLLPLAAVAVSAQGPAFDVGSVKPSAPAAGDLLDINLGTAAHGTVTMTNVTLSEAIRWAYNLVSKDQVAGPVWIDDRAIRFDITAKAGPATPDSDLRLMMRGLLAERFHLKLHTDARRIDHYELAIDPKIRTKLEASSGDKAAYRPEYGPGKLRYSHITLHTLAVLLARQLKVMVLDNTGLGGFYDIALEWTPDDAGVAGEDVYAAVRRQLGLELVRKKTPVDVWVVDYADKTPIAN